MNTSHFRQRSAAYHALLLTAEMDLNDMLPDNDSLINIAVHHYSRTKDIHHKMMSFYYKGIVKRNLGDYPAAIINFERAAQCSLKDNNPLYLGLSYRNMAAQTFDQFIDLSVVRRLRLFFRAGIHEVVPF